MLTLPSACNAQAHQTLLRDTNTVAPKLLLHLFLDLHFLEKGDPSMLRKFNAGQLDLHETFTLGVPDGREKHTPLTNNGCLYTFELDSPEAIESSVRVKTFLPQVL